MAENDENLKNYKEELLKIHEKSYDHFERQLSYISAGALGLTFVLVEKIFKDITITKWKGLLVASWILLGLTLFFNLLSHLHASKKHYRTIAEINNNKYVPEVAEKRNREIDSINIASIITLFIGILFFILYTSLNIIDMGNEKPAPKPDQTRGLPSSPPPRPTTVPSSTPQPGTGTPSSPPPRP